MLQPCHQLFGRLEINPWHPTETDCKVVSYSPVPQQSGPTGVRLALCGVEVAECVYEDAGCREGGGRLGRVRGDKLTHPLPLRATIE